MKNNLRWIFLGITILAISGTVGLLAIGEPAPGKLVPEQSSLLWRGTSPAGGAAIRANARFKVVNRGNSPVRILDVESGCGCAVPKVDPTLVAPGETAMVDVVATPPPVGERTAHITLHTDSPAMPDVHLRLRLLGSRRPPFLVGASGNLVYAGDDSLQEPRYIRVVTVEPASKTESPVIHCNVPFLSIDRTGIEEKAHPSDPCYVQRTYRYEASFTSIPPEGTFAGEVSVTDPWDATHVKTIFVQGRALPLVRAVPPRIALRAEEPRAGIGKARFAVIAREPVEGLSVQVEHGDNSPLTLKQVSSDERTNARFYEVGIKAGRAANEGVYNLLIQAPSLLLEPRVVPVSVRIGVAG